MGTGTSPVLLGTPAPSRGQGPLQTSSLCPGCEARRARRNPAQQHRATQIHHVETAGAAPSAEGSTSGGAGEAEPPWPSSHLSAAGGSSRLAPEWLSLPDLLQESEVRLRSLFPREESWELCPLSASSQPPPASPGWCLTVGTATVTCRPPDRPQDPWGSPRAPSPVPWGPTSGAVRCGGCWWLHRPGRAAGGRGGCHRLVGVLRELPAARPGPLRRREHSLGHRFSSSLDSAEQGFPRRCCGKAAASGAPRGAQPSPGHPPPRRVARGDGGDPPAQRSGPSSQAGGEFWLDKGKEHRGTTGTNRGPQPTSHIPVTSPSREGPGRAPTHSPSTPQTA